MEIQYLIDQGRKRKSNQDYAAVYQNKAGYFLAIVADGMGGHLAGDVASKMAVEELGKRFENSEIQDLEAASGWFIQNFQQENQRIFQKGQEDPAYFGMGTTIVAVILFPQEFLIAHVGDSRGYTFRNGKLQQITTDHSLVQELVNEGEITPEMARNHPQKNVVTRSIGMPGELMVDVSAIHYEENEEVLLCSDGLTNMVTDEEIAEILTQEISIKEKVMALVALANEKGGADNITAMLIRLGKGEVQ